MSPSMRAPADLPGREPRVGRPGRGRLVLILAVVLLVVIATSLRGVAGFYTDFLWFDSLGVSEVWRDVLVAKASLVALFTVGFFVLLYLNLAIADRIAPPFRVPGPEEDFLERYQELVSGRTGLLRVVVAAVLALIVGTGVSGEWDNWILFRNGGDFGIKDPELHTDIGFYVFKLPFLSFVVDWLFAALLIVFIVTVAAHYLNGGIRVAGGPRGIVTSAVKGHLSVLLALIALVKAGDYWLQRYQLTLSTRGFVDGASYTEVKAELPAINLLLLISAAGVVLFLVNIWRRGWVLPVVGVGLWALVAVVASGIYPEFVQRFQVRPNEPAREAPYIARNIEATRAGLAMGGDEVSVQPFDLNTDKDSIDLEANAASVKNIRIWDPSPEILGKTFSQLQRVRNFYGLNDVDIDRYELNGEPTQVVLSVRDLRNDELPRDSWTASHLAYTHGYGAVVAPANAKEPSGEPSFVAEDVPYSTTAEELKLTQPAVYFGERLSGYVVTGTGQREIDYQDKDDRTRYLAYDGKDGVKLDSVIDRAAFALRFGDLNPLISNQIKGGSKVHFVRDIRERVEKLAPFLSYDADPYPVILDGRIHWVIDAYTTTANYPYAQQADTSQVASGSGLRHGFNYVRNSVKAVVDAYDGDVDFYVMPVDDPIVEAYRKAFPDLFSDFEDMPKGLADHLRYPEDLFRVQTTAWGRYHIGDSGDFYNSTGRWNVAEDPGTAGAQAATQATDQQGNPVGVPREARIDPYYLFTQLPGDEAPGFIILRPFVPYSEDDQSQLLTAFMVGNSDPGPDYGKLRVFTMPTSNLPNGPALVQGEIQRDPAVSEQETLLGTRSEGSRVDYGALTAIPIDGGLVWVRPFYVTAERTELPGLEKVIVYFEGEVAIRDTLQEALSAIFGETPPTLEEGGGGEPPTSGGAPSEPSEPSGTADEQVATLLAEAERLFGEADAALAERDFATYGAKQDEARRRVERAIEILSGGSTPASGSSATPSTAPSTTTTQPVAAA